MTLRSSSAAVAARADGTVSEAYGRWHEPASVVCWASGTKVFTAAVVRSLVAEGTWTWDAPVGEILGVAAPPGMTVGALVEHRSGLPRALPEQGPTVRDPYAQWTAEQFDERVLPRLDVLGAHGAPGEVQYSNLGYAVLGRATEVGSGRRWLDLVRERVVVPLGLPADAVLVAPPDGGTGGGPFTVSSRTVRGRLLPDWDTSRGPFAAAGGMCSTVPDMVRLLGAALAAGSPLAPGDGPHAWERQGTRSWHSGALLRSGSLVVVDSATGSVAAAHAVGGAPGHGATHAERALQALLGAAGSPEPSQGSR